jgi:hypothetical protein
MPNYYDALHLAPTATAQEIENTIDRLYNETRRKVTSFDPQVAAQANQALLLLEQMRTTLLDPGLRQAYDSALGFGQAAGMLLDPSAPTAQGAPQSGPVLGMPGMGMAAVPPPGRAGVTGPVQTSAPAQAHKTTWTCTQCHRENPAKTAFCRECGGVVGLVCPKCNQMYEAAATQFCSSCGGHLATEVQRKKLQDRLALAERLLQENTTTNPRRDTDLSAFRVAILRALAWVAVIFAVRLLELAPHGLDALDYNTGSSAAIPVLTSGGMLLAGLGVTTIVLAVIFRARWTASWGALFAGLLLIGEAIFNLFEELNGQSYYSSGTFLTQLALVLIVNLAFAAQPRKFNKAFEDQPKWFKPVAIISHLCGWGFFFYAVIRFFVAAATQGAGLPIDLGNLSSLADLFYALINWLLVAILAGQAFFGIGIIAKTNTQVRDALRVQAQKTQELSSEIATLKQDISHIAR